MYAIVRSGGKQYRVERGQTLLVERLPAETGSNVALEPILYRSEEAVFDAAGLKKVKVTAKVVGHERGEKLRVFKFKPKRGYKRRTGHRQELTRIEVTDISIGAAAKATPKAAAEPAPKAADKPAPKAADKPAPKAAAKPAAAKPTGQEPDGATGAAKPARAAAAKKPAAKKPATKKEDTPDGA